MLQLALTSFQPALCGVGHKRSTSRIFSGRNIALRHLACQLLSLITCSFLRLGNREALYATARRGLVRRARTRARGRLCRLRAGSNTSARRTLGVIARRVRRLILLQTRRTLRHGDAPLRLMRFSRLLRACGTCRLSRARHRAGSLRIPRPRIRARFAAGNRFALNGRARRFGRRALFAILLRWLSLRYHVQNTLSTCGFLKRKSYAAYAWSPMTSTPPM